MAHLESKAEEQEGGEPVSDRVKEGWLFKGLGDIEQLMHDGDERHELAGDGDDSLLFSGEEVSTALTSATLAHTHMHKV